MSKDKTGESRVIAAYNLNAVGNHEYFFDDAPEDVFCSTCGCCIDPAYLPGHFKAGNKTDISATYDRRLIASLRFKEYIESLNLNVSFLPVDKNNTLFLIKPENWIEFSAFQKSNCCDQCHQYFNQVMPYPSFYHHTELVLREGIYFTKGSFGSGQAKSPSIILGTETAMLIKEAVKKYQFRGADISPVTARLKE